jgi:hypothetical protein
MSDDVVPRREGYMLPWSGVMIDPSQPAQVSQALLEWQRVQAAGIEFQRQAEQFLLQQMDERGEYTVRYGPYEVKGDTPEDDYFYDIEDVRKLADAGLPEDRMNDLIKVQVEERVDKRVAKAIAKVPKYREILERARRDVPKQRRRVKIHKLDPSE